MRHGSGAPPEPRRRGPRLARSRGPRRGGRGLPTGHPRQGRGRDRRTHDHGGPAGSLGAAHVPGRHTAPHRRCRHHRRGRQARCLQPRRGGPPGRRGRPRFLLQPFRLPVLRAEVEHSGRRCPLRRRGVRLHPLRRGQPPLQVRPQGRQHPGPGQREEDPGRTRLPRPVLPRRRGHRLRRRGQPVPVDRRRHQPLRLGRLHADRRTRLAQPGVRRPAFLRQHQRPARQDPSHQGQRRRLVLDPVREPLPVRHRQDPAGDLRDGVPQPLPHECRQGHRHRLHG